jgi:flagellar motor switch protein FliN
LNESASSRTRAGRCTECGAVSGARDTGRDTVLATGASGADLLSAQAWMERADLRRPDSAAVPARRTHMTIGETLALGPGSIITLNRLAGEPVDLLVNGTPIARGEVVVIDEESGLRITEVATGVHRPDTDIE